MASPDRLRAERLRQADAVFAAAAPPPRRETYWQPISISGLVAFLLGCAWLMLLLATDKDGFLLIVDSFNLVVHEFGHPLFGIFGEGAMWWGGTLAQLLLPLGVTVLFWRQRAALSMLLAGVWFFENFLNIARYIADARAQELPLVGGGEHDWARILGDHGWLRDDTSIASAVNAVGWAGMISCTVLALVLWYFQTREQ
ncbi:MAG: hypothetical protein WAO61_00575 [Solirubrobacterales bacterium]